MSGVSELVECLVAELGQEQVNAGASARGLHAADFSHHDPVHPDVVVFARSTDDVARTLTTASRLGVAVVPFGAGSSVDGHVIPVEHGISLDLTRMDRILAVRPTEMTVTVQAGAVRSALERAVSQHGLSFPVDPGADATLGGMAATNAAGTTTVRYGKMRSQVLALEAVLPSGRVVRAGSRALKTSAGYDLVGLLVGSEGTLAVITELTLRLHPILETTVVLTGRLPDVEIAGETAAAIVASGVPVRRLELLDGWEIRALNLMRGAELPERATLLIELAGAHAAVNDDLDTVRALLAEVAACAVETEISPQKQLRLWRLRHDAAHAERLLARGLDIVSTDVCVPLSELGAALGQARRMLDELTLTGGILSHAGDGNIHVNVAVDRSDDRHVERLNSFTERLITDALARGGTCTGEHGIGLGKREALRQEHPDLIPLMRAIKDAFDPLGILNPGKILL